MRSAAELSFLYDISVSVPQSDVLKFLLKLKRLRVEEESRLKREEQ